MKAISILLRRELSEISILKREAADYLGMYPFWGFWIGAAVVASLIGFIAYKVSSGFQEYVQFIVGQITWRAASKAQDYNVLLGIVFGFFAAFVIFLDQSAWLRRRINIHAAIEFHTLIVFASLPAVLWLGRLILTRETSLTLLGLSAFLIILVLLFSIIASLKSVKFGTVPFFSDSVSASIMAIIWGVLSGMALSLIFSRLGLMLNLSPRWSGPRFTEVSIGLFASISVVLIGLTWSRLTRTSEALLRRLRRLVIIMQGLGPWFFLILLPTPWISGGHRYYGYPLSPLAWVVIALLIIVAYGDLIRRWRFTALSRQNLVTSALSPVVMIGLLLFIKVGITAAPQIPSDDYHFGEFFLPWWSWSVHHMVPFWDYNPARGLINYLPGLFSSIFFDGTATSFEAASPFVGAFYLLLCYPIVAKSIGIFPAFIAFLLMPLANGYSEIDVLMTAALCVLCETYLRRSAATWLPIWCSVGIAAVLAGTGSGGLLVLATMPLALVATYQAGKSDRRRLFKNGGIFLITMGVVSFITPFGYMLYGAIRYGLEQSSINSIANGIEWSQSWHAAGVPINQWLWEIARSSWILVGIISGMAIINLLTSGFREGQKRGLVFAFPIFALTILFIFRAAGRIDAEGMSRLGLASIWALSLLLPILLLNMEKGRERRALLLTISTFLAAIITTQFTPFNVDAIFRRSTEVVAAPVAAVHGKDVGLPNLGDGMVEKNHLARLVSVKRTLDLLVDAGETYLDLTNRNAHYFYFGYRPFMEVGAVYNLVHINQQTRTIKRIKENPPPVVLAMAENQTHDGITVAYRSHLLYRYLVMHYVPVEINGLIYLVRPDRLTRRGYVEDAQEAGKTESRLKLVDTVFRMGFIEELPVSWGRSLKSLKNEMRLVKSVPTGSSPLLHSVRDNGVGYYRIDGPNPSITFDVSEWKLNGRDAGILTFDFTCKDASKKPSLGVYWSSKTTGPSEATVVRFNARMGALVVPLDAAPRWLLAEGINTLRFDIADPAPCAAFSIVNVRLWQRTSADQLPK
jgi:hypothetical protein